MIFDTLLPIHDCCLQNDEEQLNRLLDSKADVNAVTTPSAYTSLHIACAGKASPAVLIMLLSAGATVDCATKVLCSVTQLSAHSVFAVW